MSDARDLCAFVDASPSPFHAVAEARRRLLAAGFRELSELDAWSLAPGDAAFATRSDASLIAFRVGEPGAGFRILGAHTDSPNLRLKPNPVFTREGVAQLGVEVYGGVLLHTWLDRDLGVAGRVVLDDLSRHLVRLDEPVCRVPSLAIHLDREVNEKGLVLNRQQHLPPLLALGDADVAAQTLFSRLAATAGVDPVRIRGFDLGLYDRTPATIGGQDGAFVFAGRLDNLASCHAGLSALLGSTPGAVTQVVALFDHEEVGSSSAQGAAGPFLEDVLRRLTPPEAFSRAIAASFCVSADMAHAVHPNYADRHEPRHMPRLGRGPVIKANTQQRYATDGLTAARFRRACEQAGVVAQDFVTRTDLACGSTIGPITATRLGVPTVDVGNPMLSMHSSREMCGAADVAPMIAALGRVLAG